MKLIDKPSQTSWSALMQRPKIEQLILEKTVGDVLKTVQQKGDQALMQYTREFDGIELTNLTASSDELNAGSEQVSTELKEAIEVAYANIYAFHKSQQLAESVVETSTGVVCWRKSLPIEKVGLYIPGGSAPLFSTILMLGIPAQIAGCKELILCTPPDKNGNINPAICYAAQLVGIRNVFKIGGAQAIAAMAYGTETIPQVYKIFGPGNQYVTKAKELIQQNGIAIDMPAGPSEVLIIADESCRPDFVAADLLSQAEHGADSQVILLTDSLDVAMACMLKIETQLEELPRKALALKALNNSKTIVLNNLDECMEFSNAYAPEHLILATKNARELAESVMNAGSVFIGNYSCESAGDYASGTNHTLPTNGFAKSYSGVSLDSFVKKITFQELTQEGLNQIGQAIETMAEAEQLFAHRNAVTVRLK